MFHDPILLYSPGKLVEVSRLLKAPSTLADAQYGTDIHGVSLHDDDAEMDISVA